MTETGSGIVPEIRTEKELRQGLKSRHAILTSEDEARARKELNKAKKEARRLGMPRVSGEKAAKRRKAERKGSRKNSKVIVVDGQVVTSTVTPSAPIRGQMVLRQQAACYTIGGR